MLRPLEIVRQICHISDIHFGPPHLDDLSLGVLQFIGERQPDLVVLSGDLTQRAKPRQFHQAREFVDDIPVPSLAVPGNHDVPLYRFWERFGRPFGAYRKHFGAELEPVHRDDELLVVGINTAHGLTFKNGRFTPQRLQEVTALLADAPDGVSKVVVAHHPLVQPPWFGSQPVATNAWEAMGVFSRLGVDLILSGHLHQSFIGISETFYPRGCPPVILLHSGTTTSNRGRAGEHGRNTCNWIRIESDSLLISNYRWDPVLHRFSEHSRHLYPRHSRHPYTLEDL